MKKTKTALAALSILLGGLAANGALAAPHGGFGRGGALHGSIGGPRFRFYGYGGFHGYGGYLAFPYAFYGYPYVFGYGYGPWGWLPPSPYVYPYLAYAPYYYPGYYPPYAEPPPPPPPPPAPPMQEPQAQPPPPSAALAPSAPRPAPKTFVVYFALDRAELSAEAHDIIRDAARYAHTLDAARATVVGYTDAAGSEDYNQALSKRRSEAVRNALAKEGLQAGRIDMQWRGKHDLAVKTPDGASEASNRRVTIIIEPEGGSATGARASRAQDAAAEERAE